MKLLRHPAVGAAAHADERAQAVEHRWFPRRLAELPVDVAAAGFPSARGRTANIGLGGLFVHIPSDCLRPNDPVSVSIHLGPRRYHAQALVTRVTPEGVALMFAHLDRKTLEFLLVLETGDRLRRFEAREA